jgi:hypothetical protein
MKFSIFKELKQKLNMLEQIASSSNQEIHENIESLAICIQNNTQGLNRALFDLQALSQREGTTIGEVSTTANKILC